MAENKRASPTPSENRTEDAPRGAASGAESLRPSASQYQRLLAAIVDSSDDAIVSKDLNGIITSWNRSAERLFGYTSEEAVGRSITLIIPPERLDEEAHILEKLRRGERVDHFETVRMRKDGSKLDVSLTISPVKDAQGRVIGASKVARDISTRKLTERALSEQARLLDLSSDAILIRDTNDRITFWNQGATELYGYTREEAMGRVTHELLRTTFPEPLERIREKLLLENHWNGELVHRRKAGTEVVVLSRWVLDRDEQGNHRVTLESNNDVTRQRRTTEALREREEQLQVLTQELESKVRARTEELRELWNRLVLSQETERRNIARELHDSLGQYLVALNMVLEDAKQDARNSRQLSEALDIARTCIKEVRTLSHLLHPPLLDEAGLASAAAWYIEGFAERSGIQVHTEIDDTVAGLPNDIGLALFRILQESLTNVHRHSEARTATIRIGADSEQVWLEVRDQGKGMPADKRAGVGIKGMRERVTNLAGELQIDSNDGGTRVRVVLPLSPASRMAKAG